MAWIYDPDSQDYTYQDSQDDQSGLAGSSFMDNVFQDQQDRNRNSQVATLDKTLGYQPQDIMDAAKRVVGGLRGYGTTLANYYDLQNQSERPQLTREQVRQKNISDQIKEEQMAQSAADSADTTNPFIPARNIANHLFNPLQAMQDIGNAPDIPYYSDFARGTLRPGVREGGNLLRPPTEIGGVSLPGAGDILSGLIPANSAEVGLTAAPFVGELRGAPGAVYRGLRGYGGRVLESGLGQESALPAEIAAETRFRNPLPVEDMQSLPQTAGEAVQGRHTIQGPANSQLEWRSYPNGDAHIVNVNAGDVQGQGVGTRLLQKAIADIRAANPDAIITADLNSEGGARLFARQPDAEFTDMRGNPISAQEAAAAADRAEGPHVTLPSQPAQRELSMVGGGANLSDEDIAKLRQLLPETAPVSDMRAVLENLGYDSAGKSQAAVRTTYSNLISQGKLPDWPIAGPKEVPPAQPNVPSEQIQPPGQVVPENVPVSSDAELEAQTRRNLGMEGGEQPPRPPTGNDYYAGDQGDLFNARNNGPNGEPLGVENPGSSFPSQPDVVEPQPEKSLAQKVWEGTIGNAGALTGLKSSLTPPFLRQGLARFVTSPVSAIRELGTSLKGALNEANYTKVMDIIEQDPMVRKSAGPIGQANMDSPIPAGYSWQDRGGTILQAGEKADVNTLPEELQVWKQSPIGRHLEESKAGGWSSRQAALELNLHRTNWYKEAASALWQSGETDPDRYTALVKEIEHFTQRGSVSQGQVPVMFSTRAISGRIQAANDLLTNGVYRGILRGQALQPGVAREAAKVLAGESIYNSIRIGVPVALGAGSIELKDGLPTLKIGNQHFDPWAGFGSMSKVVYRTAVAVDKASKGNTGSLSGSQFVGTAAGKELLGYARKSLGPAFGKSADVLTGKDVFGRKYDVEKDVKSGKFFADLAAPLLIGDLFDAFKVAGAGGAALRAPSSFLSEGGNDYVDQNQAPVASGGPKPWEGNVSSPVQVGPKKPWQE